MQNLLWVTQTDFIRGNVTMCASDLEFKLVYFKLFRWIITTNEALDANST